ncbi:MAG: hypothetical protein HKP58_08980 [Desulfatitalea sp.]|nr:hypothetical protein [Desulfatitalea sp.]NNK00533.1 hypothetical protein [Desulfatitalea sp.]
MTTMNCTSHLTHDELLTALVDTEDLHAGRKEHLRACARCSHDLAQLTFRFTRMGQTARKLAPAPSRPFRLPQRREKPSAFFLRPVWLMGLTAALLLAITIWRPQWMPHTDVPFRMAYDATAERELMARIDELVDDALPKPYQQLSAVNAPVVIVNPMVDEDLINWVVPSIDKNDADKAEKRML